MKKLIYPLTCLAVLLANIAHGDDLPFFSLLREEIANQLTIASNTPPLDRRLVAGLRSNLLLVNRTKPTLIAGSTALGTLARSLGRTSLSNTFLPILTDTRTVYLDVLVIEKSALAGRLAVTIPGRTRSTAQTALDKLSAAIEGATTNANLTASLNALKKAATALGAAKTAVTRAETAKPGANFLTATVTESNQGQTVFKPTRSTFLDAYYDPSSGEIDIDAGDLKNLGRGRAQVRLLTLAAIVPGEGTYTLSLTNANEGYAYYQRAVALNINAPYPDVEFQEFYATVDPFNRTLGSGTMTITLDLDLNLVWGEFTFTATGSEDPNLHVTMTGSFLVRLTEFGEFE